MTQAHLRTHTHTCTHTHTHIHTYIPIVQYYYLGPSSSEANASSFHFTLDSTESPQHLMLHSILFSKYVPLFCPGVLLHFSFVYGNPPLHSPPVWHPQLLSPASFHPLSFCPPFSLTNIGPEALLTCLLLFLSLGKYVYSSGLSELCRYLSYLTKRKPPLLNKYSHPPTPHHRISCGLSQ